MLVPVSARGLAKKSKARLGVHDALDHHNGALRVADTREGHSVGKHLSAMPLPRRQAARSSDTACDSAAGPKGLRSKGTSVISAPRAPA